MSAPRITASVADFAIERSRRIEDKKTAELTKAAERDTFSISTDATLLQDAEMIAAETPDVDMKKVEEVRQAIARGELKIDYEKLAQKMLEFETSLEQ